MGFFWAYSLRTTLMFRIVVICMALVSLAACAKRDDFMAACYGNEQCADRLASEKNNETAKNVALGVLLVGAAAAVGVAASKSGGRGYSSPSHRGQPDRYCGMYGGPGWRRANGRCASWRD